MKKSDYIPWEQLKKRLLEDPETKKAYEELEPEFAIIRAIIKKRQETGITQKELAERIGTKQSAISRLESGTYNPSLEFLKRLARALDVKLEIQFK